MVKIIALLPMKGNSERVKNKNLKYFAGKPLYHYTMQTLLDSKYIESVVVNTDSEFIKEDIKKNFPEKTIIIDRPKNIVGNFVSMNKIIEHDISSLDADFYVQSHSTNPMLSVNSLDCAIEKMFQLAESNSHDSIFSVTKWQTRLYKKDAVAFNHNPKELLRTQDLEPLFEENSNFYIFSKNSFKEAGNKRIGKHPYLFEIDKIEAVDIDEPQDFIIAEALYKLLR